MLKKTIFHETHEIVFQTIPSDMSREMMPAMGRPFSLGYFYDKRTDTILNEKILNKFCLILGENCHQISHKGYRKQVNSSSFDIANGDLAHVVKEWFGTSNFQLS